MILIRVIVFYIKLCWYFYRSSSCLGLRGICEKKESKIILSEKRAVSQERLQRWIINVSLTVSMFHIFNKYNVVHINRKRKNHGSVIC